MELMMYNKFKYNHVAVDKLVDAAKSFQAVYEEMVQVIEGKNKHICELQEIIEQLRKELKDRPEALEENARKIADGEKTMPDDYYREGVTTAQDFNTKWKKQR